MSEGLNYTPKEEISQLHDDEASGANETAEKIKNLEKETQELKEINDAAENLLTILERRGEETAKEILKQ